MDLKKMLVALVAGGAALGAGFTVASAQTEPPGTAPPTTKAPAPTTPDSDHDRDHGSQPHGRNCDKDGDGEPDERPDGATAEDAGFFRT